MKRIRTKFPPKVVKLDNNTWVASKKRKSTEVKKQVERKFKRRKATRYCRKLSRELTVERLMSLVITYKQMPWGKRNAKLKQDKIKAEEQLIKLGVLTEDGHWYNLEKYDCIIPTLKRFNEW